MFRGTSRVTVLFALTFLYISLDTFSNLYTQSDEHSISAEFFNESKSLRASARRSPLWPLSRAEPSHKDKMWTDTRKLAGTYIPSLATPDRQTKELFNTNQDLDWLRDLTSRTAMQMQTVMEVVR